MVNKKYVEYFFILIILLVNGLSNATVYNLIISVPQLLFVTYLIITGQYKRAIFWHFLFIITSYTYYGGGAEGIELIKSYNYAKLKLIGPLSFSHVLVLALFVVFKVNTKKRKNDIYSKFVTLIETLMLIGFSIGIIGLLFGGYYLEGFIHYGSYIFIIYVHTYLLLKNNDNKLKLKFYNITLFLLSVSPIIQFVLISSDPLFTESTALTYYSVLLVPALLYEKKIFLILVGLLFHIHNMVVFAASGKGIILVVIFVIITLILSFKREIKDKFQVRARIIRVISLYLFISIPAIATLIGTVYGGEAFTVSKIYQVRTLFEFVFLGGGIENIADSPYIRVASLYNIIYEGILNPFTLIFGKGFGGYFQDNLNYFVGMDLSKGAFSNKAIANGEFYSGHDTMVTIPMFNGLFGLFLIIKFISSALKELLINMNYFLLACIPFLLFVFYYDTLIGITGVLLVYIGSINKANIK